MRVKKEAVHSVTDLSLSTGVTLGLPLPPSPLADWTAHARPVKAMKPAFLVKLPKRALQTNMAATYLLTGTVDMTKSMTMTESATMTESISMTDPVIIIETMIMTGHAGVEAVLAPAAVHPLLVVTGTGAVPGTVAQGMTAGLGTAVRRSEYQSRDSHRNSDRDRHQDRQQDRHQDRHQDRQQDRHQDRHYSDARGRSSQPTQDRDSRDRYG